MAKQQELKAREAEHGRKMIEIQIRFWTNDIATKKGQIIPKHAWSSGVIKIQSNRFHGIEPSNPIPFHSLLDIGEKIEKALIQHGITLHLTGKMEKYIETT